MNEPQIDDSVGAIVAGCPALARVFEDAGIDYCCGGKKTLNEACREQGLHPQTVLAALTESTQSTQVEPVADTAAMALTELADHIERGRRFWFHPIQWPNLAVFRQNPSHSNPHH